MNDLQIFENSEFGSVRTITVDGEPYFVGKDIVERLNYETFSYNSIIPNGKRKQDIEFLETIQGKSDVWEDLVNIDFSCLTDTEKQIVKLICEGYNQMEMKEIMGLSQSYISRIITRIKKKLGKELYNEL